MAAIFLYHQRSAAIVLHHSITMNKRHIVWKLKEKSFFFSHWNCERMVLKKCGYIVLFTRQESLPPSSYPAHMDVSTMENAFFSPLYHSWHTLFSRIGRSTFCRLLGRWPPLIFKKFSIPTIPEKKKENIFQIFFLFDFLLLVKVKANKWFTVFNFVCQTPSGHSCHHSGIGISIRIGQTRRLN